MYDYEKIQKNIEAFIATGDEAIKKNLDFDGYHSEVDVRDYVLWSLCRPILTSYGALLEEISVQGDITKKFWEKSKVDESDIMFKLNEINKKLDKLLSEN